MFRVQPGGTLILALWRQKQAGLWVQGSPGLHSKFQANQNYIMRLNLKNKQVKQKIIFRLCICGGRTDDLVVKSTDWSSKCPEFKSQQPLGGSQLSIMGSDELFWRKCVYADSIHS